MKRLLLLILLLMTSAHLHAQEPDTNGELVSTSSKNLFDCNVSPVFIGLTYDRVLSPRHLLEVTVKTCNYLPIFYSSVTLGYKYYPSGIVINPEQWTTRSIIQAGVEVLPDFALTKETGVAPYVGGSLELRRRSFFIRPTLTAVYPLTIKRGQVSLPSPKDVLIMSALMSVGSTTIGFRF